jgi:3'-5' exoribonuclease
MEITRTEVAGELHKDEARHLWIKDIQEGIQVQGRYLVQSKRMGRTRRGDPFLSITLVDRTGEIEAKVWESVEAISPLFHEGDIVDVAGQAHSFRNQIQLTLSRLTAFPEDPDPSLFLETTTKDVPEMTKRLKAILNQIGNPHLKALVDRFLSDAVFMAGFRRAPAAKHFHHSYLGGLLEHTLSVSEMMLHVAVHYKELDGDLLLASAFLHDIGKIREFNFKRHIDYSNEGRLLGHISLGLMMVEDKLKGMKDFPEDLSLKLKHLILSHHGEYEFGSPKRPKTLEAFALHLVDDLDAKMAGLGRFIEKDTQEGLWTDFNRLYGRHFLKGEITDSQEVGEREIQEDDRQGRLFMAHEGQ